VVSGLRVVLDIVSSERWVVEVLFYPSVAMYSPWGGGGGVGMLLIFGAVHFGF
jgi:hypothetical protein